MARRNIQITGLGKLKQNQEQDLTREVGIYHSFCRSVLVSSKRQVRPTSRVIEVIIYQEIFLLYQKFSLTLSICKVGKCFASKLCFMIVCI